MYLSVMQTANRHRRTGTATISSNACWSNVCASVVTDEAHSTFEARHMVEAVAAVPAAPAVPERRDVAARSALPIFAMAWLRACK